MGVVFQEDVMPPFGDYYNKFFGPPLLLDIICKIQNLFF
jgi:hypothetical protein